MKRRNLILVGVLIAQIALTAVVFWPRSATAVEQEPLFPDLESDEIVSLTITDGDGNQILLEQEGDEWVLPEAGNYPALPDNVAALLDKIANLTTGRLVTRTETSHRRLQVTAEEFVRRVDFETAGGEEHTLYLGSSPSFGAVHFRLAGQSETYLTNDIAVADVPAQASGWVDTAYVSVPQAQVTRLQLENNQGTFTFERDDEGNWTMVELEADETLANTRVTATIRQATSIRLQRPLGTEELPEYGMDDPNAVVTLEREEGDPITIQVGTQDPDDNSYVVISSESSYYVRVSEMGAKNLVEYGREDFLESPTTPTPES